MAKKTPTVKDKRITFWDLETGNKIVELDITDGRDHQTFVELIETYKSFRYLGAEGTSCTVVKEMRPQFGNKENRKPTWYAHKRHQGKLHRRYIGKSSNLTYEKLKEVAFILSQRKPL